MAHARSFDRRLSGVVCAVLTPCVTMGNELCDGFESGTLDLQKWLPPKPNSAMVAVTLDDSKAHSGTHAVHIHGVAGQINNGVIAETVTFPR